MIKRAVGYDHQYRSAHIYILQSCDIKTVTGCKPREHIILERDARCFKPRDRGFVLIQQLKRTLAVHTAYMSYSTDTPLCISLAGVSINPRFRKGSPSCLHNVCTASPGTHSIARGVRRSYLLPREKMEVPVRSVPRCPQCPHMTLSLQVLPLEVLPWHSVLLGTAPVGTAPAMVPPHRDHYRPPALRNDPCR